MKFYNVTIIFKIGKISNVNLLQNQVIHFVRSKED